MGYATVQNVPRVTEYEVAKRTHDNTKPIRGSDTRPLGARRDHDQYSVKAKEVEGQELPSIEFICYRTPVVTFHPDNTITIKTDGWASVSTHQFIHQVLGIQANGYLNFTVLTINETKYMIGKSGVMTLKSEGGNWCILSEQPPEKSYGINRKAANNVRARYKPFANYLRGFSKVRAEEIKPRWGEAYTGIRFNVQELVAAFGMSKQYDDHVIWPGVSVLMGRGRGGHVEKGEEMLALISSDDLEKWHKAALWFFGHDFDSTINTRKVIDTYYNTRRATVGFKNFDEFILRWHAEEVIDIRLTEKGKLPNLKYADWLIER